MASGAGGQYRINVVWTSHGGQVLATMGQIQSGMRQVGGAAQSHGRNVGYFNRQMMALGTTMRYFFAGGAIFGSMSAFQQFAEFESRLGNLAALAPEITANLTSFGNAFLRNSTAIATPVTEIEDSARNILSTMQLTEQQMGQFLPQWTTLFSQGARIAETDAYNFGNAVMGMNRAFQRDLGQMENTAGQFFTVIQKSAGMTGDEWAKFSGRVVAGAGQAGASLEEMNALMILMTRQGATAATNARHMSQMLMQIRNPTQESTPFWREIGLGPEELRTLPFDTILQKLVTEVRKRGGLKRGRALSDDAVMALEEQGDVGLDALGMRGGGMGLLMDLFGRIESRRAAGVIISEILAGARPGAESYDQLLTTLRDTEAQTKKVDEAFDAWLDRNRIQQAGIALRNMLTEALVPAERRIAGIAAFITEQADPRIAQGAAAAAGGYGAWRLLRGGREALRGMGRFARGAGTAGIAVTQAGAPPSGSFANPFWVIIHPMSNIPGMGGGRMGGGTTTGGRTIHRQPGRFSRLGGQLGRASLIGAPLVIGNEMLDPDNRLSLLDKLSGEGYYDRKDWSGERRRGQSRQERISKLMRQYGISRAQAAMVESGTRASAGAGLVGTFSPAEAARVNEILGSRAGGGPFGSVFENIQRAMNVSGQRRGEGGSVEIGINLSPEAKKLLEVTARTSGGGARGSRVHVPLGHNAWKGGATPRLRGNFRTVRGGD